MRVRLAVLAACGAAGVACGGADLPPPPNVVLYVTDTLRADSLEPYGNPVVSTPNLARLAKEGTLYRNAYATSTWTRPSVASILTGLAPDVHRVEKRRDRLPEQVVLLSEQLAAHGFATACINTNPNVGAVFGFDQGYDEFVELYPATTGDHVDARELRAASDRVSEVAIRWLSRVDSPFFLFVLSVDPHWPYTPPARFDRYGGGYDGPVDGTGFRSRKRLGAADRRRVRSLYDAEVSFMDDSLGALLEHLRARGRLDETLFVFTSDHGEEFWEHGRNGHGRALFGETLRVPLIVRYPGRVAAGVVREEPVSTVDLVPSILALTGLPASLDLDGRRLATGAEGGDPAATDRAIHARLDLRGRQETWIEYPWKLISVDPQWRRPELRSGLYDLAADPGESKNLLVALPDRAEALRQKLVARAGEVERRRSAVGSTAVGEPEPVDIPDDVRDALEALGYVDEP